MWIGVQIAGEEVAAEGLEHRARWGCQHTNLLCGSTPHRDERRLPDLIKAVYVELKRTLLLLCKALVGQWARHS